MANRTKTKYIVIHTLASNKKNKMTVASLRAMHKARGFSDIGYNEWIDQDAKLRKGRGVHAKGAHVAGYNSIAYGIGWEGGHKGNDASPAQMRALLKRVREICEIFPDAVVTGHRDLSPDGDRDGVVEPHEWTKMCPWFNAEIWAKQNGLSYANFSGHVDKADPLPEPPDKRIMWLQKLLRMTGANIVADGWVGPATEAAVREFEQSYGLPVTGSLETRATVDKLKEVATAASPVEKVPEKVQKVVEHVAAEERTSTSEIGSIAVGVGGATTALSGVSEAVSSVKDSTTALMDAGPWILLGVVILGIAVYLWMERRKKKTMAREVLAL